MIEVKKKLLLVDGHSLIHRAYHAFPATLSTATGEQTNAVYGFTRMLLEAIHELKPTHVAVAFDLPGPTFRETMFVGYKRSRAKPDDAMIAQIPRVKEVVQTLGIPIFEVPGFEADDVIGTLARLASTSDHESRRAKQAVQKTQKTQTTGKSENQVVREPEETDIRHSGNQAIRPSGFPSIPKNTRVIILTSDRDLMQLIHDEQVVVQIPTRGKRRIMNNEQRTEDDLWNESRFVNEWGFKPELLPDFKAFAGDQSDDIPGVRGIGEKTGKELVRRYGGVNNVYGSLFKRKAESGKRKGSDLYASRFTLHASLLKKLAEDQESAQMSKKLATIDTDVPINLDWGAMEVHGYDKIKAIRLFDELQFKSLVGRLPNDSFEESVQEVLF